MDVTGPKIIYRQVMLGILAVLMVALPMLSFSYGITVDEEAQQAYGELVFRYFSSGFRDKSALNFSDLYLYGGMFDFFCVVFQKIFHGIDKYAVRHCVNALVGWIGLVFTARLAAGLRGWRCGLIALGLILLSPMYFGHMMNNPKDIPFASFHIMALFYYWKFAKEFPSPSKATLVKTTLATALAINARVGGLILLAYAGLICAILPLKKTGTPRPTGKILVKTMSLWLLFCATTMVLGTVFWPWAQVDPFRRLVSALAQASHFNLMLPVRFRGITFMSNNLPWEYVPWGIFITTPALVLVGLLLAPIAGINRTSRAAVMTLALVICSPVIYVILRKSVLYDGVRHFLFVYPPLCILSAMGIDGFFEWLKRSTIHRAYSLIILATFGLLGLLPLRFLIFEHPNQTVYFNEIVGGTRGAYLHYELDYWGNCSKETVEWLSRQSEKLGRPVKFGAGGIGPNVFRLAAEGRQNVSYLGDNNLSGDFYVEILRTVDEDTATLISQPGFANLITADDAPLCVIFNGPINKPHQ